MRRLALLCLLAVNAFAGGSSVYLNGVNIDGLTNQTFEKATVKLDAKGNVYIDAPGYQVQKVPATPEKQEEVVMSKKYFLVTEQTPLGMTEYDIELSINGKLLRTLHNGDEQIVSEITKHLHPGKNTVLLSARKLPGNKEKLRSTNAAHVFRVIIGEGSAAGDQVTIEMPIITFTRTAAEVADVAQEFTLTTH